MGVDPYDFLIEEIICSESEPIRRTISLSQREEREENREWITKREMIASTQKNNNHKIVKLAGVNWCCLSQQSGHQFGATCSTN